MREKLLIFCFYSGDIGSICRVSLPFSLKAPFTPLLCTIALIPHKCCNWDQLVVPFVLRIMSEVFWVFAPLKSTGDATVMSLPV